MNLFLSSMHFGAEPQRILPLLVTHKRAAICLNANDGLPDQGRYLYLPETLLTLQALGITGEEIDLRTYFGKPQQLMEKLQEYGLFWATGGNTFVLRRAFHACGLDALLRALLNQPAFTYGGFSAGACVVTPSLKGIEQVDDPYQVPPGYPHLPLWDGINLVNFCIVPHLNTNLPGVAPLMAAMSAKFTADHILHYTLTDDQAIIVTPNGVTLI